MRIGYFIELVMITWISDNTHQNDALSLNPFFVNERDTKTEAFACGENIGLQSMTHKNIHGKSHLWY